MNNNLTISIYGSGGHGKVVGEIASLNGFKIIDFYDDNYKSIKNFNFTLKGTFGDMIKNKKKYDTFFVAIGDNKIRSVKLKRLIKHKLNITNLIHPTAVISKLVKIDRGICFMANSVVNPGSVIKFGAIINTSASIDHDCSIGKYCHISPNCSLSGKVKVGNYTWIGTGSSVKDEITIGTNCIVGIGSKVY